MESMKIGVFDSGIGGTTTLKEMQKKLPNEEFVYFADSKNNPYGEKSDAELWEIVTKIVENFKRQGIKLIVVACNTATTRLIDRLRKNYPEITFVGTEPAIKLACNSGFSNILVMATPGTIEAEKTKALIFKNKKPNQKITLLKCAGLADAIEFDKDIDKKLDELLAPLSGQGFDAIVLGCTHYILIREKIQKFFEDAKMVDGNAGITKRVSQIVKNMEWWPDSDFSL